MTNAEPGSCRYCNGTGKRWRKWLGRYELCIPCDGSGKDVPPVDETLRAFRKRLRDG